MNAKRHVLIDANLLVLLVVGIADISLISRHKRTRAFLDKDFSLLLQILSGFKTILVTPTVMTEASNLLGQATGPDRDLVMSTLATLISKFEEEYIRSIDATHQSDFLRLGLTDAVILRSAGAVDCIITADLDLYLALSKAGHNVVNFNHVRMSGWAS